MPRGDSIGLPSFERSKGQYKRKAELAGVSPDASFEEINQAFFDAQNRRLAELLKQEGIEIGDNVSESELTNAVDAGIAKLGDKGIEIYRRVHKEFELDWLLNQER